MLSIKRNAAQKALDLAELVSIQGKLRAAEKRKEDSNRQKIDTPSKIVLSPDTISPRHQNPTFKKK